MATKAPEDINSAKPSDHHKCTGLHDHHDEYEALHDEITMCQHEMHRTWLWAIIPAGAVYTWLPLHTAQVSTPFPLLVWFIPAAFVFLCGIRYWSFWCRIEQLGKYQCDLEEEAFGNGKEGKLCGIARSNLEDRHRKIFLNGACLVWVFLVGFSSALSLLLSPMKSDGWAWMGLVAGLIGCSFALYHYLPLTRSNGTLNKGPAYGHTQEFRQQLAESVPVKDWGYKIQDVRFSEDYHKALVIFGVPGKNAVQDAVLEDDGFRRYKGSVRDYDKVAAAKPGDLATAQAGTASITVTLPNK